MKQKYYFLLTFLLITIIGIYYSQQDTTDTNTIINTTKTYPSTSNFDFYSISDIDQNNFSGTYNTEGYVVHVYTCPPYPKDAFCKMCREPNILIYEETEVSDISSQKENQMIIFTTGTNPKQFELNKKYKFSINITESKSTNAPITDIKLIGYD